MTITRRGVTCESFVWGRLLRIRVREEERDIEICILDAACRVACRFHETRRTHRRLDTGLSSKEKLACVLTIRHVMYGETTSVIQQYHAWSMYVRRLTTTMTVLLVYNLLKQRQRQRQS